MKLYFGPGSCSYAALIALEECDADYDAIPVLLANGEQRKSEFLAISPKGMVPVLINGQDILRENLAILTYVAVQFPEAELLPFGSPIKMAKTYEFLSWFATDLHSAIAHIFRPERFAEDEAIKAALKEAGQVNFQAALDRFDEWARNEPGPWIGGDRFGLADTLAPVAARWAKRLDIDYVDRSNFAALVDQVNARPAVGRAAAREEA